MSYIDRLCVKCKLIIGSADYRGYQDSADNHRYYVHFPMCYEALKKDVQVEYIYLLYNAAKKEVR